MKKTIKRVNKYIHRVTNLFNVSHRLDGKFKMFFSPANDVPDSDGTTVLDTYLIPVDKSARQSIAKDGETFLHLQILGNTVPEDFLGYEFDVQVEGGKTSVPGKVDSHVYNVEWKDVNLADYLFDLLNSNLSHAG